jgi:hypothetical protein
MDLSQFDPGAKKDEKGEQNGMALGVTQAPQLLFGQFSHVA